MPTKKSNSVPESNDNEIPVWMMTVNGMRVDIRLMPLRAQEVALMQGLIPYIPHYKLLAEMEGALPITFRPTRSLVQTLAGHGIKVNRQAKLLVTELFDAKDEGGIVCSVKTAGNEESIVASITGLIPDPKHPLAAAIEEYRKLRIQSLQLGLLNG